MPATVECACGCGTIISATGSRGRPVRYVIGHAGAGNFAPHLKPTTAFACRLAWLMLYGPCGPLRQIDVVRRSRELGVPLTAATVNSLVTGASDPSLATLGKLATVLGVPMAELVTFEIGEPRGSVAHLLCVQWNGRGFEPTGASVDVPTLILPAHIGHSLAVIASPSANAAPLAFEEDLLIIDLDQREPEDGALMLITREPGSSTLLLMRAFLETNGVRYADASGYIFAESQLCQAEVVAVLSRIKREPGDSVLAQLYERVRVLRSVPVRREEVIAL